MKLIFTIITILVVSCGPKEEDLREFTSVNPEFEELYQEFEGICGIDPHFVTIDFGTTERSEVMAQCDRYSSGNQITVKQSFWEHSGPEMRRWLIFHELGHCALGKDHDERRDGLRPLSIMVSVIPLSAPFYLQEHRAEYYKDLCRIK